MTIRAWDDSPVTGRAGHPDDYQEFCKNRAAVLIAAADTSARAYLAGTSPLGQVDAFSAALAAAWALVDGELWGARDSAGHSPRRTHYATLESMVVATATPTLIEGETLGALIDAVVASWQSAVPAQPWPTIGQGTLGGDVWRGVPIPDHATIAAAAHDRLGGIDAQDYVAVRTRDAGAAMVEALALAGKGEVSAAIGEAYRADLSAVEAYLIASALAAGDTMLLTVSSRWALVSAALGEIEELPGDLRGAISSVRTAIFGALGPQDGARVASFLPVL